jgi:hypothetical protein
VGSSSSQTHIRSEEHAERNWDREDRGVSTPNRICAIGRGARLGGVRTAACRGSRRSDGLERRTDDWRGRRHGDGRYAFLDFKVHTLKEPIKKSVNKNEWLRRLIE